MTGRYYFFDSYWIDEPGSWYYANRNVGYNVFSYSASPYVKWEGGLYLPLFSGSNFVEEIYWIKATISPFYKKKWQPGIKIRFSHFFNGFKDCLGCGPTWPNFYIGAGFTYYTRGVSFTAETGLFKILKDKDLLAPIYSSGFFSSLGEKWHLWIEIRYVPCFECLLYKNYVDFNAGLSFASSKSWSIDIGLAYENNLSENLIKIWKGDLKYVYPLVGIQWHPTGSSEKPDETKPFFD